MESYSRRIVQSVRDRLGEPESKPITIVLLAAAALLVPLLALWIYTLSELPNTEELQKSSFESATIVYSRDGEELTTYQDRQRRWVTLDQISPHVVNALLATEDHRFYDHSGIDVVRAVGSTFRTIGGSTQGGSTITMQLARNAYPGVYNDVMLRRKVKEWITALRLEAMYSKDEILEMYLNTVPFMYNAFGIEAAAQTYFQVPASELNIRGAAILIGMLKGTVRYNPYRHPERAHERRNVVLKQMVRHGYLEEADYERMRDVETRLDFKRLTRSNEIAPHFAEHLRQWLDEWAETRGYNLYTDGLRVYTTIDSRLQRAAQEALDRVGAQLQAVADVEWSRSRSPFFSADGSAYPSYRANVAPFDYFWSTKQELLDRFIRSTARFDRLVDQGVSADEALGQLRADVAFVDSVKTSRQRLQAGFVAINPRDGFVAAWVGGRDFGEVQYDHVVQSRRQSGSTFKPFVFAAALENGYSPNDRIRDEIVTYVDPDTRVRWSPRNVGQATGQMMTLKDALAYSKNTITVQLTQRLGPHRVAEYARRIGITSPQDPVPSIGLGTSDVSLLELTSAYTTFATNGTRHEPVFVTRIEDRSGRVLASFSPRPQRSISSSTAYEVLDMMRGAVEYGTARGIRRFMGGGDLAAKTGTTQNGADGWFVLLHPNLVMGAWVGFDVPTISFRSNYWGQGAHNALPIVGNFVSAARSVAPEVLSDASFAPPSGYVPRYTFSDTLFYTAADYIDSLAYDMFTTDYDDSTWRSVYDSLYEDRSWTSSDSLYRDTISREASGYEVPIEELSEEDSLNRLQRQRPLRGSGRDDRVQEPARGRSGEAPGQQRSQRPPDAEDARDEAPQPIPELPPVEPPVGDSLRTDSPG
jgi:penicillin-binding protein 1A